MEISRIWSVLLVSVVAACGGGGGSSPPPTAPPPPPAATLSGQFKDANVSGLGYSTPSRSGITDARGTFVYSPGESIQFSVGGITIGSSPGKAIVTPVDLVAGGSADTPEVQNIVRFLMMLDLNDDASDGIEISANVRQMASNWSPVDFAANEFDASLATVVSDVASVDGRPAALPDSQTARDHLRGTVHCALSGFFRGSLTGGRTGTLVMIVNPASGQVVGLSHRSATSNYESDEGVSVDSVRTFAALSTSGNGDTIEGRYDSYDEISGVYTIGGSTGEFTASRRLPDATATYRFTGYYYRVSVGTRLTGPLVLNVDAQGSLRAEGYDLPLGNTFGANGTYIDGEFEYDYGDGQRQFGTTDSALYVEGNGSTVNGAPRPWFAQGCRLN